MMPRLDMVSVVRCRQCEHYARKAGECRRTDHHMKSPPGGFCHWAEPRPMTGGGR